MRIREDGDQMGLVWKHVFVQCYMVSQIRSDLHPGTGHVYPHIQSILLSFHFGCLETDGCPHLPPCQPAGPPLCLSLCGFLRVLGHHVQLAGQGHAGLGGGGIDGLLGLYCLCDTALGLLG